MSEDDGEICGRCLVQVNANTAVQAIWPDGTRQEFAPNPTDTLALKRWIQNRWYIDCCRFEINAWNQAVKAVSTWNGDPVCVIHLRERVQAEMRGR